MLRLNSSDIWILESYVVSGILESLYFLPVRRSLSHFHSSVFPSDPAHILSLSCSSSSLLSRNALFVFFLYWASSILPPSLLPSRALHFLSYSQLESATFCLSPTYVYLAFKSLETFRFRIISVSVYFFYIMLHYWF